MFITLYRIHFAGRPKVPIATYTVKLVPGDPGKCTLNNVMS